MRGGRALWTCIQE